MSLDFILGSVGQTILIAFLVFLGIKVTSAFIKFLLFVAVVILGIVFLLNTGII